MHTSTRTGNAGYQSILESRLFYPVRKYQCLEFFYYNSGSKNDRLNIYIKQYIPGYPNGINILVDTISGKKSMVLQGTAPKTVSCRTHAQPSSISQK